MWGADKSLNKQVPRWELYPEVEKLIPKCIYAVFLDALVIGAPLPPSRLELHGLRGLGSLGH